MRKKKKLWSVTRIKHPKYPGYTVRVGEYEPGGTLHVFRWLNGKQTSQSLKLRRADLGSTNTQQVKEARRAGCMWIEELVTKPTSNGTLTDPTKPTAALTLTQLADQYEARGFFGTSEGYKKQQIASIRRIAEYLKDKPVAALKPSDLADYREHRLRGGVTAAAHGDLVALSIGINWAVGEGLLDTNPLATKRARDAIKIEHKPRRPVTTPDRYQKLKAVAPSLPPAFGVLLDVGWHTGHRISAILGLRWRDVKLEATQDAPHGSITWYAGVRPDRKKHEHTVAMNTEAHAALRRWKPAKVFAQALVFPDPADASKPLPRFAAKRWLKQAETRAKVGHERQGGWHMLRRGWATARKHLPIQDVAAGGGWLDTAPPAQIYQQADAETTLKVVTHVA